MKHQGLPGFMLGSPKSFRIDFLRYFRYNIPVFVLQNLIPGSSVVEQLAVNQLVVGSNPTPGAKNLMAK